MRTITTKRWPAVRRLLRDLLHADTRMDALARVRRRATRVLRGGPGGQAPVGGARPSGGRTREAARQARRDRAQASLDETVAAGGDLALAVCAGVADLAAVQDWSAAWAMAENVGRLPGGATASILGHAVLLHRQHQLARAWKLISDRADDLLATCIPVEAVDAALAAGTPADRRRALAIGMPTRTMDAPLLVDLAGRFLAFDESERARALVEELRCRPAGGLDDRRLKSLAWIEDQLSRRPRAIPPGSVAIGALGYRSPDHQLTSANVGDHVQTLAMLGSFVRLDGVTVTGDDGLGELAGELRDRVQPGLRLSDVEGAVHLVEIDRDCNGVRDLPDPTWVVAFGWHQLPLYRSRYDFPYHPSIRPLFVSFHVDRLEILTEEAMAYFRRYGPIGCRDWNTVFLLLSAGVDAFFTGCLTTTIGTLYPPRRTSSNGRGVVGVIDVPRGRTRPVGGNVRVTTHQSDEYRNIPLVDGLRAASAVLETYRQDLASAVTGRLHAYLPLAALGVPVEFTPPFAGDVRFAGLTGLHPGDRRLIEMGDRIRDLLARMFARVVAGATEDEVYALWRDLTQDRVAEARARFGAPIGEPPSTTIDVRAAAAASRRGGRRFGPHETVDAQAVTDVALAFDRSLAYPAAVLLESIVAHASGPLRLWVLGRQLQDADQAWLAAAFPDVPMTFLPCDEIGYGPTAVVRPRDAGTTDSDLDWLLLPELLTDVDRVVYLDIDTLVLDDVCHLAGTDLGDRPAAARDSFTSEAGEWRRAGRHLAEPVATELRREMGLRHGYGSPALNTGVLVLDLDRMRRDDFAAVSLGWVEHAGLDGVGSLLAYVGPDRATLDPSWNAMPSLEDVHEPRIIHWEGLGKPWEPMLTYGQDRWRSFAERLRERAGTPPSALV